MLMIIEDQGKWSVYRFQRTSDLSIGNAGLAKLLARIAVQGRKERWEVSLPATI
jgi:hypothetical protein